MFELRVMIIVTIKTLYAALFIKVQWLVSCVAVEDEEGVGCNW